MTTPRRTTRPSPFPAALALLLSAVGPAPEAGAFVPPSPPLRSSSPPFLRTSRTVVGSTDGGAEDDAGVPPAAAAARKPRLGLLTFDLDDTLYPVSPVFVDANSAFASAMSTHGYGDIRPNDIAETGRRIREEVSERDPAEAAALTFTETRMRAIRRQMENVNLAKGLEEVAKDWATPVSALNPVVVESCRKFASAEVSPSVVQAVYNAWEMERHHSAERNVYPEVLEVLQSIKDNHPGVVIGAVTDGRADPLLMPFTLAKYFDFCVNWEDDQGGRTKFFQELNEAESGDLTWIYRAALDKYRMLSKGRRSLRRKGKDCDLADPECVAEADDVWIHVGDDLAYDVGGSASCGARTVLMELDDKYGQTERLRGDGTKDKRPEWDLESKADVERRREMNAVAEGKVDARVNFVGRLPEAIDDILEAVAESRA